ncbi:hypothetical protein MJT46_007734 [Ovis ammon polii x Ovis aries]|nr:hypothetical protein MJT46_007734 [Ovis ammon polii x Ovis aries]
MSDSCEKKIKGRRMEAELEDSVLTFIPIFYWNNMPGFPGFSEGRSVAQTVTQPQPEESVQEADTVILDCTYTTSESDYYLFWYKQPPSGQMVFIIHQYAYEQQNSTNDRYSVNFQKEAKAFSLRISDSQLEDAAMYFCAYSGAQTGVSGKNGVEQSPRYLSAQEGDLITINCNYLEGMTTLQWLQQNPGGSIISLLTLSLEMKKKGRVETVQGNVQICTWLLCTLSGSDNVESADVPTVYKKEGESVTVECKFSVSYTYYMMYWYRQPSSGEMIYMINIYSQSKQTREGRYSVEFYKPNQMLKLTISALTLSDSAVYFCAVREFHVWYKES